MTEEEPYYRRLIAPPTHGLLAVWAGAVFVLLASVFVRGGPLPAFVLLMIAGFGLVLRYTGAPVVVLLGLVYLQFFPLGVPSDFYQEGPLWLSRFRLTDMLLAAAAVVYLAAQYRLYAQLERAVPEELVKGRQPAVPPRRPGPVADGELARLVGLAGLSVFLGQIAWLALTGLDLRFDDIPPLRVHRGRGDTDLFSRIGLFVFAGAVWVVLVRLVFGLWRQARWTAAEGRQVLLDIGWQEVRREAARQQYWRARATRPKGTPAPAGPGIGCIFFYLLIGLLLMLGFAVGVWVLRQLME